MTLSQTDHTPLMQQYLEIKALYQDALVLFQVGDFYELFYDDAKKASAFLGIALTARGKNKGEPIPLCGVPVHAKDHYLTKLVKGGFNVAICEQLEPPRPGVIVKRGVTQVLTPGTLTDTKLLDAKSASYLFSFFPLEDQWGLVFGELLTAQLFATVVKAGDQRLLESELVRFFPDEVLLPSNKLGKSLQPLFKRAGYCTTPLDFSSHSAQEQQDVAAWIRSQFKQSVVAAIEQQEALRLAFYYFYAYVRRNQRAAVEQVYNLNIYQSDDFLILDPATQSNLELVKNNQGTAQHTLFAAVDGAMTPMGSRMIKKWLLRPLVKQEAIAQRLDVLAFFVRSVALAQHLIDLLVQIGDVERVIGRIGLGRAQLHDFLLLKQALGLLPAVQSLLQEHSHLLPLLTVITKHIEDFSALYQLLSCALHDEIGHDWIIKKGFDQELDELRELVFNSDQKIIALEQQEQQKTGIQSLKIRYNQVQGYYIEITKTNLPAVPAYYIRQQTLVGRERFITPELQELQQGIVKARMAIEQVEAALFERVKQESVSYIHALRRLAHSLAHLDALLGLARVAYANGYVRPEFNQNRELHILEGRHPVVEQTSASLFIPNDTHLTDEQSLWIVTGPNMGGKSTYLRQVAQIAVLAQIGSFVPAKQASLAVLDRIFTRIGAGDSLAEGKSTFLVEMEETATICTQATRNSLVILDEVGRGTSTFDGLAIAQAVVEYIYKTVQARCLFATHYHELTHLQETFPGIVSYYAASKKTEQGITFLYKICKGVADGSFGVEVAKLAGLPSVIIGRAEHLLQGLTSTHTVTPAMLQAPENEGDQQMIVVKNRELKDRVDRLEMHAQQTAGLINALHEVDFDNLSPKKAFDLLWELKERVRADNS